MNPDFSQPDQAHMKHSFAPLLAAVLTAAGSLFGQVYTPPVGYVSLAVPANSDASLGAPLDRANEFTGQVLTIGASSITPQGTPGWTTDQFVQVLPSQVKTYAVRISSGAKEGLILKVVSNTTNSLLLATGSTTAEDLSGIVAGDSFDVFPLWTPTSLFGTALPDNTQLFLYDNDAAGTNPAPSAPLAYFNGFGWFETLNYTDMSHRAIKPGTGFIVRNDSSSEITVTLVGSVPMSKHRVVLKTLGANQMQDQRIVYSSPIPESLASVALGAEDYDEIFLFTSGSTGYNQPPTPLVHAAGRWYNSITFTDVTDTTTLQPGSAFVYRKAATGTPSSFVWTDLQSYLQ